MGNFIKILVFSPYYPPHIGGLETHADEFNKYLSHKEIDITVFTPRLPKDAPENEMRHNGVKIIRFPAFEIVSNYPLPKFWSLKFWHLFFALFKEKFDIAISRTRFFSTSLLALVYAKIKNVKWVHIEHGSDFVKSGGKLSVIFAKIYDYTFGKLVLISADKLVANSKASAEFCKKIAGNINCEVIYRGVETERIKNVTPNTELENRFNGKTKIVFIGRLIDGKGVADLIEAIKDIQAVLFIIGDGPQKKYLENLARKYGIEEKIVFFGYKNFEEAIGILKISDIFVNPSYTEGLPTSVIEAALCGVPIIATGVGGTNEIISGNNDGILISPKNRGMLAEKIKILLENKHLREIYGKNAFATVTYKYSWKDAASSYEMLFRKMLEK
jgi:glycosyltransferase involved in cell wall biosynthesis